MNSSLLPDVSSNDIVSHGRFPRHTFDGLATGKYGTVAEIMDTFLQQQSQMLDHIVSDLAIHGWVQKSAFYRIMDYFYLCLQKHWSYSPLLERLHQKSNSIFYHDCLAIKGFDRTYKIWIYNHELINEKTMEWFDAEILWYFRQLWYTVSIQYPQWSGAWAAIGLWIRICAK